MPSLKQLPVILLCLLLAPVLRAQQGIDLPAAAAWPAKNPQGHLLDLRPAAAYAQSHLPGAQSLPAGDSSFARLLAAFPKSTPLLLYGKNGPDGEAAAKRLQRSGYRQAHFVEGGIDYWHRNDYPLAGATTRVGMTRAEFDSLLHGSDVVLVDFFADFCGYCPPVRESAERLGKEHAGALRVIAIDAELHPDLCASLGISRFPTLHLYQLGNPVWRQVGYVPHAVIDFKVRHGLREQLPVLPEEKLIAGAR